MVPIIAIVDRDARAAQMTGALVSRVCPTAQLRIIAPQFLATALAGDRPIALLLLDPAGTSDLALQQLQALQHHQPTMHIVVLTAEPAARCAQVVRLVTVAAVLDKGAQPAALLDRLQHVIDHYATDACAAGSGEDALPVPVTP
jgi:FixJ family two-component response regulator